MEKTKRQRYHDETKISEKTRSPHLSTCLFLPSNRPRMARHFHATKTTKWGATPTYFQNILYRLWGERREVIVKGMLKYVGIIRMFSEVHTWANEYVDLPSAPYN